MVPVAVLADTTINDRAFRVWCSIATFADYTTGETFAAQASIAERMGVSVDTVQRAMKQLVGAGWLLVTPRLISGRKVGNIYTIVNGNRSSAASGSRKPQNGSTETADEHATETATGAVSYYQTNYQTTQDRAASRFPPLQVEVCARCRSTDECRCNEPRSAEA